VIRRAASRLGRGWDAFWFAPADPLPLATARIACGAIVFLWALSLAPDLGAFYSEAGLTAGAAPQRDWWEPSLLAAAGSELAVGAVYVALIAASASLALGWHSRASAAVAFIAMTTLARANPYVLNSGDTLLRLVVFFLMLAPSGAALSLDRRRARLRGAEPATVRAWPVRLIQIQISAMYAMAVWSKLGGEEWRDGTAASYAMRLPDLVRFHLPPALERSELVAHAATYGTLVVEAGLAVLIWHKRTRVPALLAGLVLHLSIDATIRVGFFTLAVLAAYLSLSRPTALLAGARAMAARRPELPGWRRSPPAVRR
jgi:hypothetical protein